MEENKATVPFEVGSQLCDMNFAIKCFLTQFAEFRKTNVVDKVLCENLSVLVEEIDTYLDSEPTEIQSPKFSNYEINLNANHLENDLFCRACQTKVAKRVRTIEKHIHLEKHLDAIAGITRKADKQKRKDKKEKKAKKEKPERTALYKKMSAFVRSDFIKYLTETAAVATSLIQIPAYDEIRQSLTNSLSEVYPNVKIYFFGSRINGLGNVDSDLDVYIDIDDTYNKSLGSEAMQIHVYKVRRILEALRTKEWRDFTAITSARTPILKLYNSTHRIDCDVSFSSLGECNTLLVKYLIELQPLGRKICLFMKKWFKSSSYCECFSSYVFSLMVIFNFQRQSLLPAVFILQHCVEPSLVGQWQTNFANIPLHEFNMKSIPDTPENLIKQLISLFSFYTTFNYGKFIICPYTGTLIARDGFNNMPDVFVRYDQLRVKCSKKELFQMDKPVCVQDPLEHNHNVAKGITNRVLRAFVDDCRITTVELQARAQAMNIKLDAGNC